jgi:alkylation response protein AidB-like acyl-CoA dehydrogenase
MDFSLSDIQQQLQDSVLRFVRDQYAFESWRKVVATEKGFKDENWKQMAELGWLGVAVPEDFGGLGGGPVDTAVIMEGFGRGLVAEPYLTTAVIGGNFLAKGGSEAVKQELLPKLVEGNLKLAFAQAEPTSRFNLADVQTTAKKSGSDYTLDGQKAVVFDADRHSAHRGLPLRQAGHHRVPGRPQGAGRLASRVPHARQPPWRRGGVEGREGRQRRGARQGR